MIYPLFASTHSVLMYILAKLRKGEFRLSCERVAGQVLSDSSARECHRTKANGNSRRRHQILVIHTSAVGLALCFAKRSLTRTYGKFVSAMSTYYQVPLAVGVSPGGSDEDLVVRGARYKRWGVEINCRACNPGSLIRRFRRLPSPGPLWRCLSSLFPSLLPGCMGPPL
ncbi:hypothetical protein EDD15DRAFT_1409794 [Pisolithus albus]|nr:hypothetical protein EDD15DRAFT_1409794 [Pisolithus albus]